MISLYLVSITIYYHDRSTCQEESIINSIPWSLLAEPIKKGLGSPSLVLILILYIQSECNQRSTGQSQVKWGYDLGGHPSQSSHCA